MAGEDLRELGRGGDEAVARLLDVAFHRSERESRVARELARAHPSFDPALALSLVEHGQPVAFALGLPRRIFVRGVPVAMLVLGPVATAPEARGRGLATRLVGELLARAAGRDARGAVALGAPELFRPHGFAPAFDLFGLRVPAEVLSNEAPTERWRGLAAEDLPGLRELCLRAYARVSGGEERTGDALDFESLAPRAHTLVHPGERGPLAYLRFRVREELEVTECGADGAAGIAAVLAMLRRLCSEHGRLALFARLPEPHPVARALFHRGALAERSHFGGAAMLAVLDWRRLLADLAPLLTELLAGLGEPRLSLGIGARTLRLELAPDGLRVGEGAPLGEHLALPPELAPALLTGERGFEELLDDARVHGESRLTAAMERRLAAFLGPHPAMWCYAPVFELADD